MSSKHPRKAPPRLVDQTSPDPRTRPTSDSGDLRANLRSRTVLGRLSIESIEEHP